MFFAAGADFGPFFAASASSAPNAVSGLENALVFSDFSVGGPAAVSGSLEAMVRDPADGKVLARTALDGRTVVVYGAKSPVGPWEKISVQRTGEEGEWAVDRARDCTCFRAALEE